MKTVALVMLLFSSVARADSVLEQWLKAQNDGDFTKYASLYADAFVGIRRSGNRTAKLDRDGWLRDRQRMFKSKMSVTATDVRETAGADGAHLRFKQTWSSGTYQDVGDKELVIAKDRIVREEMLTSQVVGPTLLLIPKTEAQVRADVETILDDMKNALVPAPLVTDKKGLVLAVCAGEDVERVTDLFLAIDSRVVTKPAGKRELACPHLEKTRNDNIPPKPAWEWPETSDLSFGGNRLSLLVFRNDDEESGDFARHFQSNLIVVVLRDKKGTLLDHIAIESASNFAEPARISPGKTSFAVSEEYVDQPCNGNDDHRWQQLERTLTIGAQDGKITSRKKLRKLKSGRCDDSERRSMEGR